MKRDQFVRFWKDLTVKTGDCDLSELSRKIAGQPFCITHLHISEDVDGTIFHKNFKMWWGQIGDPAEISLNRARLQVTPSAPVTFGEIIEHLPVDGQEGRLETQFVKISSVKPEIDLNLILTPEELESWGHHSGHTFFFGQGLLDWHSEIFNKSPKPRQSCLIGCTYFMEAILKEAPHRDEL